ncbi:aldo/keto reductase [Pseudactinotalea sp.]|uniref:aldo/keto reductase n=1 Tax=Pseudactinotalea sp. TaxID=1926260 RepID=UPI003B3B4768
MTAIPGPASWPAAVVTIGTSGLGQVPPDGDPSAPVTPAEVELAIGMLTSAHALVDTSNMYAGGRSEQVLGAAIRELGGLPEGIVVLSKADRDLETGAFDRDRVWRSFEESTARLGLDRLPLYQLHDPYTITFEQAMGPGGAVQGLTELRDQGLVGAIGVAAGPSELMAGYVRTGAFEVLLSHNRYTLVDASAASLFHEAAQRGMAVLNAAPFGGGLLANGSTNSTRYGYRPASDELLDWVARLRRTCAEHGVSTGALALRFSTRSPWVRSTVVGISSLRRLAELDALLAEPIPENVWDAVEALGTPPSTLTD